MLGRKENITNLRKTTPIFLTRTHKHEHTLTEEIAFLASFKQGVNQLAHHSALFFNLSHVSHIQPMS